MKVVVGLCAALPFTGWPLLTGPWLPNSITLTSFTAGDQTEMDRSFPSCTTEHVHQQRQNGCFRDGIQRSNRVWICCCRLMKSWLIMFFYTKFALVRSDDWWVSFTCPWAVFTRLGRPDEWLVRTLHPKPDFLYVFYTKFHSHRQIFYWPCLEFTCTVPALASGRVLVSLTACASSGVK